LLDHDDGTHLLNALLALQNLKRFGANEMQKQSKVKQSNPSKMHMMIFQNCSLLRF